MPQNPFIHLIGHSKVRVSRHGVALFNSHWPCSELHSNRSYWFEFDKNGNLIDTDIPEQDDGQAALALSQDCQEYLFHSTLPDWVK